jgi:hypothetical protein
VAQAASRTSAAWALGKQRDVSLIGERRLLHYPGRMRSYVVVAVTARAADGIPGATSPGTLNRPNPATYLLYFPVRHQSVLVRGVPHDN